MLTAELKVNGCPIGILTAVNQKMVDDRGKTKYRIDLYDMNTALLQSFSIWHHRNDGAWALVNKALEIHFMGRFCDEEEK